MMSNLSQEIKKKINSIIADKNLDILILSDLYNIQYATGVKVPYSHAEKDLFMIAVLDKKNVSTVILPKSWKASAERSKFEVNLVTYSIENAPQTEIKRLLSEAINGANNIGSDDQLVSISLSKLIDEVLQNANKKDCDVEIIAARKEKTETEIKHLSSIALKTDHAINGYYHHLIADRSKSSMSVSENLRIHSLERDIELEGYHACSRGVIGDSTKNIWAYAPNFGFASSDFTDIGDPIIADAMNNERGYWNNATRMAIMADEMNEDQEHAYEQLNRLREIVCELLKIGKKFSDIYQEAIATARDQNLTIIKEHALGFSVGVSAMEGPFISAGDDTVLKSKMTLIIDGIISHKEKYYRGRDTILMGENGPEILNWYKDWREPYFALNTI